jgi:hypothetical protein
MGPNCRTALSASFSLTAQLPDQDVSGDDQTHLSAAKTQNLCLIMHTQSVHNKIQNLCLIMHTQSVHNKIQNLCLDYTVFNEDPLLI